MAAGGDSGRAEAAKGASAMMAAASMPHRKVANGLGSKDFGREKAWKGIIWAPEESAPEGNRRQRRVAKTVNASFRAVKRVENRGINHYSHSQGL
jgi:hypothetical protein